MEITEIAMELTELKQKVHILSEIVDLQDKALLALAIVVKKLPTKDEVRLIIAEHVFSEEKLK